MSLTIAEMPAPIWELKPTFHLKADRSGVTVFEYLQQRGVNWVFGDSKDADLSLYKGNVGRISLKGCLGELKRRLDARPSLLLLGEPREYASGAYLLARPGSTMAVAPGDQFHRLYFASEWIDPQLDGWHQRMDRICWIARPTPERVELARQMERKGFPLDVFSRARWPVDSWRGFAEDEVETARNYRYRIVCENSSRYGYHSEKLFNSVRSGCVSFYQGDPSVDLSHLSRGFVRLTIEALQRRQDLAEETLSGMENFMFGTAWEIYSFRSFYDRIILLSQELLDGSMVRHSAIR